MTHRLKLLHAVAAALLVMLAPLTFAQPSTPPWRNGSQEKSCGLGTYHDGLNLAFKNATDTSGETLVALQILPSFHREYALVLKRVGSDLKLVRATFHDQLWTQLGPPLHVPKTRQQCLDAAAAAKVDVVEIPLPPETTQQIWTAFRKIDLATDYCPRRKKKCALFMDGTAYVIQTNNGRLERLTEIGTSEGIRSENAALLDWVHSVLQQVSKSQ